MPKSGRMKYYAVRVGRGGPKVYNTWDECKAKISRYPGAVHKRFFSRKEAEEWLSYSSSSANRQSQSGRTPDTAIDVDDIACLSDSYSDIITSSCTPLPVHTPDTAIDIDIIEPLASGSKSDSKYSLKSFHDPSNITFSPEQRQVLERVREKRSVFFTGSAGTGKSVLLREIIRILGGPASPTLGITASTGIASVNISGTTLHSWAGIGLGQETLKNVVGKLLHQPKFGKVLERWQKVETLMIDEISMIDARLFDYLESIARLLRGNHAPFGGIQLVLSGDFCQLPPVAGRDEKGRPTTPMFAFDAQTWNDCVGQPVILTRVFRQKDKAFVDMLNSMRFGKLDEEAIEAFSRLSRMVTYTDGIEPTGIYSTRAEVENANSSQLRRLTGESHTYEASDTSGADSKGEQVSHIQMERLLERLIAPKVIQLKVGAQVMLIKNLIQGHLVNGSVGQVVRFCTPAQAIQEHTEIPNLEGPEGRRRQLPSSMATWPVVRFINGREIMCIPEEFTINNADGAMEARREQIPLILAWALSVHKSQGQTLERVKVDLRRTFEKGQAYVALSRATTMEHLQVLNFDTDKVTAHPRVIEWYNGAHCQDDEMYFDDEMDNEEAMEAYYVM